VISYRTLDVPPYGAGAFMPAPARNPVASSWGLVHVEGAPGTNPVPSPAPCAVPSLTVQGGRDSAQGSNVAPDVILPAIYTASARNMGPAADAGFGMARRRLNELPVRAIDPGRQPVPVWQQFPAGARPLPWPRAFIHWPSRTGTNSGRQDLGRGAR
jgi:hypothetical protein